jgi:hypothetical protein
VNVVVPRNYCKSERIERREFRAGSVGATPVGDKSNLETGAAEDNSPADEPSLPPARRSTIARTIHTAATATG